VVAKEEETLSAIPAPQSCHPSRMTSAVVNETSDGSLISSLMATTTSEQQSDVVDWLSLKSAESWESKLPLEGALGLKFEV
jgi:hypothetical protein